MSKGKKLAKNTIILGIGQLIPKILAVITLPVLTKTFSTSEFGIYDLIISFSSLILPLMTLLIQQSVFRYLIDDDSEEAKNKYITNAISLVSSLSIIYLLLLVIVSLIFNLDIKLLLCAFLLYFFDCIYDLFGQISRGINKNSWYSAASAIYSISNVILLLCAYYFKILNIDTALIIIGLSYFVSSVFLAIRIKILNYINFKILSKKVIKEMLSYSVPIVPSSISLWVVNLSDRMIVTTVLGTAANGIYAAACKVPNMYATVFGIFNLAWTEHASRNLKEKDSVEHYSNLFNSLVYFMIGIMLFLISCSKWIFEILIDKKFIEGYNQLPILYVSIFASCLVSFYGGLYIAFKETRKAGISSLVGAILNIAINILFVKKIGIYAASISTLVSFTAILLYRIIDIRKYIKLSYSYIKIIISILILLISIALFYFNNNIIVLIINIVIAIIYNLIFNDFALKILKRRK